MTDSHPDRSDGGSRFSLSRRLDKICDQFEVAWKAGERPQIEDYLAAWNADPAALFAELLPPELELRDQLGEAPAIDEYLERFPEYADLVRAVIGQADTIGSPEAGAETTDLAHGSHGLKIRCPHCHNPIELVEDQALAEMTCPTCGSTFGVTGAHSQSGIAVGKSIGHFELLDQLGTGGFGTVFQARDTQLDRLVALKIPRRSQLSADEIEKFIREARAAAQLQHPNIVSVHEVGREGETVYIVSDLIEGLPLNDWIEDQQLTPREAAALCQKIALALHHAHEAGVVHRDLKPSNIMIDVDGEPHIMDFGLAKREAGEITMTLEGQILGTPAYMSPEQARGEGYQADRRSDVYSLGVILYELLTGERPFRGNIRMLLKAVIEDEPVALRKLDARIPRDLETIALKCLEKEPSKRYATADSLADELVRYDRGEPIQSRSISQTARAWRWCKRNRSVASLTTAVFLVLVVGLIGVSFFGFEALKEKRRADDKTAIAKGEAAAALRAEGEARFESRRANVVLHRIRMELAFRAWQERDIVRAEQILAEVSPLFQDSWETRHLITQCQRSILPLKGHVRSVKSVCFSPDGKTIASGSSDGTLKLWDAKSRQEKLTLRGHFSTVTSGCFSPDGLTIVSGSWDRTLKLWDVQSGKERCTLEGHTGSVNSVCFSPDGKRIVSGSWDKTLKLWDVQSGMERSTLEGHTDSVNSVSFSPDGETILSGSSDGTLKLWDATSGKLKSTLKGSTGGVNSACFNISGSYIASGNSDGTLILWAAESGELKLKLRGHFGELNSISFSRSIPKRETIASLGSDGTFKLWNIDKGELKLTLKGQSSGIDCICFSPDCKAIVGGSSDGTLLLWDIQSSTVKLTIEPYECGIEGICFSPDGKTIASGGHLKYFELGEPEQAGTLKTLKLWDAQSGEEKLTLNGHTSNINCVCFSPDGKGIVSGSSDGTLKLWDIQNGQEKLTLNGHTNAVKSVHFSPDGKTIVSGSSDKTLKLWDAKSGELRLTVRGHKGSINSVCFSPDGKTVASGSSDETLKLWDAKSGREKTTLRGHADTISCVCFSPDGMTIVSASWDRMLKLWDVRSGEEKLTLKGHDNKINSVCFSPDGNTIASGNVSQTSEKRWIGHIKLWDTQSGEEKLTLNRHDREINSVCFSPDGNTIASGCSSGTLNLWEAIPIPITSTTETDDAEIEEDRHDGVSQKNPLPELVNSIPNSKKRRIHIVALVAGDYAAGHELDHSIDDLEKVVEILWNQSGLYYSMGIVEALLDHEITRENVEKLSTKLSHNSIAISPDDLLFVYLSGHGVAISAEDYYFLPPDPAIGSFDVDLIKKKGISWQQLRIFADIPCRKVFMLDTDFQSNSLLTRGNAAIRLRNLIRPSRRAETIVLTACGLGKTSWQSDDFGHGLFTQGVLEALQGHADGYTQERQSEKHRDGVVELRELVEYVISRVPRLAREAGVRQTPNSSGDDLGYVPLVGKLKEKED